jgi:hypothetical protein
MVQTHRLSRAAVCSCTSDAGRLVLRYVVAACVKTFKGSHRISNDVCLTLRFVR